MAHQRFTRAEKLWSFIPGFTIDLTGDGTFAVGSIAFTSPSTVIRMLGQYIIVPTTAPTALDQAKVVIGIGKVSTDAVAAGAGSLPDPSQEPNYPWLYWATHSLFFGGTSADPASLGAAVRAEFDIRSMRKMRSGQSLAFVMQYVNDAGNPPLTLNAGSTRVLITV